MSPSIPAQCTRCGHKWQPQGGIRIENSSDITIGGGSLPCPRLGCGGRGQWLQGTFDVTDGAIVMKSGPDWSWDLVEHLRLGLRRVVEEAPDDPLAEVESLAPSFGQRLRRVTQGWTREQVMTLLGLILMILTWAEVTPKDIAEWLTDVPDQINELLEHVARNGPPPSVPPEPPAHPGPSPD